MIYDDTINATSYMHLFVSIDKMLYLFMYRYRGTLGTARTS